MKTVLFASIILWLLSCAPEEPQKDHTWVYTNWQTAKNTQPAYRCLDKGNSCVLGSSHPLPPGTSPGQWKISSDSLFNILKVHEANNSITSFFSDTIQWESLVPPQLIGYKTIADVQNNIIKVGIGADSSIYFYKGNSGFIADSVLLIWKWNE